MATKKKPTKSIHVAIGCLFRPVSQDASTGQASFIGGEGHYEVLLAKRREQQLPEIDNKWELPGGKVEANEAPGHAVEREFLEETGYRVRAKTQLARVFTVVRDYPDFRQNTHVVCFHCDLMSPKKAETKPNSKIGDVAWFQIDDIDFLKVLAGSREFLVDLAVQLGIKLQSAWYKTTSLAEFRVPLSILPKKGGAKHQDRRGRQYNLIIQFDPNAIAGFDPEVQKPYLMVTHRGGLRRKVGQNLTYPFADHRSMLEAAKKRIRKRREHGYVLTRWDADFPLIEWMKQEGFPILDQNQTDVDIQPLLPSFGGEQDDN